jgi:phytoene synthase
MMIDRKLAASYRRAEVVARARARNFYYSFVLLPAEKRRAFCAVYAFMRDCDDISDGAFDLLEKQRQLAAWRSRLDAAISGNLDGNPILPAFEDTVRRFSIPAKYFHWIIDGTEMDLTANRYETFDDLYRYCFHVASAVGLVSLQIFGYKGERAQEHAEHCGIAFQLTNILRDVGEDAGMGRIYIPEDDLEKFQYSPDDLRRGIVDDRFRRLMAFEAARARDYYARARNLLPMVDKISRPALWAMMEIYSRILQKIARRRYDVFRKRVRLSAAEKSAIALRAFSMRLFNSGQSAVDSRQ